MQKITTFLWFDGQAEEAVTFYTSIFKNAKRGRIARYGDAGPMPKGTVLTAAFEIEGLEFVALNGGPQYHFTPAISFAVNCDTQKEIDDLCEKLSAGGEEKIQCGWLTDKYGVSWQIVPRTLAAMVQDPDPERSNRVMTALMPMKKLDIAALKRAYEQR